MYGLIIKKEWLDLILSKKKSLEIRGSKTSHINEPIYLLESNTQKVRGVCTITKCEAITQDFWLINQNKHCVAINFDELKERYKTPYAWSISDIKIIENKKYKHPRGSVIWVKDVEKLF